MNYPVPASPQTVVPFQFGALDQNPAAVYLARLTPKSRRTMRESLDVISRLATQNQQHALEFNWALLRYQHTSAIRSALADRYAPSTTNRMLSALRGTLQESWRLGLMSAEDYHRAADVKNVKSQQLPAGRALEAAETAALTQTCVEDTSPAGVRDAAILGVLRSGLRRFEVANLDLSDIDLRDGGLKVRSGKGRKDRMVYLTAGAIAALNQWLQLRTLETGPLFYPINKAGRITQRRLSDEAIRTILLKRVEQAEINHLSPHDYRRTFASDLLDAGADLSVVQKLMGHSDPATTTKYDRRGEAAKRRAVDLLN